MYRYIGFMELLGFANVGLVFPLLNFKWMRNILISTDLMFKLLISS